MLVMLPVLTPWRCAAVLTVLFVSTAQAVPPLLTRLDVQFHEDGVLVRVHSPPGELNRLEVSEDLVNWRVATVMFNSTGVVEFISEAHPAKAQFFRATVSPPEQQLSVVSLPPAVSDGSAGFVSISENGGTVARTGLVADFRAGEIAGSVRAALVPGPATFPAVSPVWDARVRQLGP